MTYQKIIEEFRTYCAEYFSLSTSDMQASRARFRQQMEYYIEKAWDDGFEAGRKK